MLPSRTVARSPRTGPDKFCLHDSVCYNSAQFAAKMSDTYQGVSYGFEMRIRRRGGRIATKKVQVIYEKDTHQQLLSEMGRVLREFGCSLDGVDLEEFLMHLTGFTRVDRPIILNGRGLPPLDDERPPGYDYKVNWMLEDRNLIDALVRLVFSRLDLVARNSTIIQPTPILNGAASVDGSRTYRKAVIFYTVSPVSETNIGIDYMRVQIDGDGTGRKTFQFDHSKEWMINRYRAHNVD